MEILKFHNKKNLMFLYNIKTYILKILKLNFEIKFLKILKSKTLLNWLLIIFM